MDRLYESTIVSAPYPDGRWSVPFREAIRLPKNINPTRRGITMVSLSGSSSSRISVSDAMKAYEDERSQREQQDTHRVTLSLGHLTEVAERVANDADLTADTRVGRFDSARAALDGGGSTDDASAPRGLPGGNSDSVSERQALEILTDKHNLGRPQQRAIGAILNGTMKIQESGPDAGTPEEVVRDRDKVKKAEDVRDHLSSALDKIAHTLGVASIANEKPEDFTARLQQEVESVKDKANKGAPANSIPLDKIQSLVNDLGSAIEGETTSIAKPSITGHKEVELQFNQLADAVGVEKIDPSK